MVVTRDLVGPVAVSLAPGSAAVADESCLSWYCMHAIRDAAFSGLPSWKRIPGFRVSTQAWARCW